MYDELPRDGGSPFGSAHPVLLIGIVMFVLPFFSYLSFLKWIPGWLTGLGIAAILIGAALSIYTVSMR